MALLHNDVLPFYREKEMPVGKVRSPRTNGFVERWHWMVLDEFFRQAFRTKLYLSAQELQADLDAYNTERSPSGSASVAPELPKHGQEAD